MTSTEEISEPAVEIAALTQRVIANNHKTTHKAEQEPIMNCGTVVVVIVICATLFFALFIILLAMPNSRLRSSVMEILGWTVSAGSAVLLISPVDLIPLFPVIGQIDDVGYIITCIGGAVLAYRQRQQRELLPPAD